VLKTLRALRSIRGTPLNIFGYARVRRVERQLIGAYRHLLETLLTDLNEDNYRIAVQIAGLPELIRGYEDIKLASVDEFHCQVNALLGQFRAANAAMAAVSMDDGGDDGTPL
jgi:indolepyruvate ferredoxin oxidoreductase